MKTTETEEQAKNEAEEVIVTFDGNNGKFFNKKNIKYFLYVNLGVLLTAIGIYFFKTPNGFATGGVSGLSLVISEALPILTQGQYMLIINIILLIIGFLVLGKRT
jgi:uncharacterized membrane-anchored protein YitT (DUF2179 family)